MVERKNRWGRLWSYITNPKDSSNNDRQDNEKSEAAFQEEYELAELLQYKSPNLTINLPGAAGSENITWCFVLIGVILQSAAVGIGALGIFYFEPPEDEPKPPSEGFTIWASGTVFVTVGVLMCSYAVKACTNVYTVKPRCTREECITTLNCLTQNSRHTLETSDGNYQIIKLQKQLPNMTLPAFALFNDAKFNQSRRGPIVRISQRMCLPPGTNLPPACNSFREKGIERTGKSYVGALLSLIGSVLNISGFVMQNMGIQEMYWGGMFGSSIYVTRGIC
jgi:hypothetical protein